MTQQLPLFYSSIAVINRQNDRALRVAGGDRSVAFARVTHLVPAVTDEFAAAARELPIVFVMSGGQPNPVFVTGLEIGSNVFVTPDGKWKARYVPAYLRRYPFILGDAGGPESVICIDGGHGVPDEADGDALFTAEGANTPFLDAAINFAKAYFEAAKRTEAFVRTLITHDLLKDISLEVKSPEANPIAVHAFKAVDEEKLGKLPGEVFLSLRSNGTLALIYAHLFSMAAFANVNDKAFETPADRAAAPDAAVKTEDDVKTKDHMTEENQTGQDQAGEDPE